MIDNGNKPGEISSTGVKHLLQAARFSWKGLKTGVKEETALRQELFLCLILIPAAFFVGRSLQETVLLIVVLLLIVLVELLNSAIEAVVDRISMERHPLSGKAKDMGSAAVLISLVIGALVWFAVVYQRYLS